VDIAFLGQLVDGVGDGSAGQQRHPTQGLGLGATHMIQMIQDAVVADGKAELFQVLSQGHHEGVSQTGMRNHEFSVEIHGVLQYLYIKTIHRFNIDYKPNAIKKPS
jgi:hypothetical protein